MMEPCLSGMAEEPDFAGKGDRRSNDRYRTIWRVAKVVRDGDAGLWRVRNISDRGMMLLADVPIAEGERLEIALSETVSFQARVIWSGEGRCGVAFDEAVDGAAVLKQLAAEQRSGDYRAPRLPVRTPAQLVSNDQKSDIELVNLSQSGAGFVHHSHLEVGKSLELLLAGGVKRTGIVRWSRGGRGGLWLTVPLDRADLESIRRFDA